jgi:XXXCH domain-containing protein
MSASEKKFKRTLPRREATAFLRAMADVLEGKCDHLPHMLADIPLPVTKLEIKGKARENGWVFKAKLKSEAPFEGGTVRRSGQQDSPSTLSASGLPAGYKSLKRSVKTSFNAIGNAIKNQTRPAPGVMSAFLAGAEEMLTFRGNAYGEPHYASFRQACRELGEAYEADNWEALRSRYAALVQMKKDCHKIYKGHTRDHPVVPPPAD